MADSAAPQAASGEPSPPIPPTDGVGLETPVDTKPVVNAEVKAGEAKPVVPAEIEPKEEAVSQEAEEKSETSEIKLETVALEVETKKDVLSNITSEVKAKFPPVDNKAGENIVQEIPLNTAVLLKKIEELEKANTVPSTEKLRSELKTREDEVDLLKTRVKNLETELQAALSKPGSKNHEMIENIKQQHEELLSKARGMIFDKTKMVKNQELQIEALTTQVQSLKDINTITKDLLEIRNSEVKAMEDRLEAMEAKFKAEKVRHGLMLQKAETSTSLNGDLKREYEMQLGLFKELRVKYEERVQALVAENARLKDLTIALKGDPTPPATK